MLWSKLPAAGLCMFALVGCASNEIWTTPLAPPRAAIDRCAVTTTTGAPETPVDNLASVRCHFTGEGKSCADLAIEQACHVGGDFLYGLHYEGMDMMGTIAVSKSRLEASRSSGPGSMYAPAAAPLQDQETGKSSQ